MLVLRIKIVFIFVLEGRMGRNLEAYTDDIVVNVSQKVIYSPT